MGGYHRTGPSGGAKCFLIVFIFWAIIAFIALGAKSVYGRDQGQWQYQAPDISAYFQSLMQPDYPTASCCGAGDAYYADDTALSPSGQTIAIITDTRPDEPLARAHIAIGTRVPIPPSKLRKVAIPNPTDHVLVFLMQGEFGTNVFCYEPMALN
jgi:hypothetical protein